MFLKVCSAFFEDVNDNGVIFYRVWHFRLHFKHRLKKVFELFIFFSIFSNNVFVVIGLNSADDVWRRSWHAESATASANLLKGWAESTFCLCCVCSTIGNVLSVEMCVALFCGWVNCCGNGLFWVKRSVKESGIVFCWALCLVTMNWACACRS